MDGLDARILRELTQAQTVLPSRPGVGPSLREIARKLSTPSGTVRYRVRQMYAAKIFFGSLIYPNPHLLGLEAGAYTADVPPDENKPEVVLRLRSVNGAISLHDFVGSLVWVVFLYENDQDLAAKLQMMEGMAGTQGIFSHIPYPPCSLSPTRLEVELILRLLDKGFDSYRNLAKEFGLSIRTLERTVSKLVRESAILSLPKVDYHRMTGRIPADLVVVFRNIDVAKASANNIIQLIGDDLLLAALWDKLGMCSVVLPNISAAAALSEKVRNFEGVVEARVELVKDHIDQMSGMRGYFEKWMKARELNPPIQAVSRKNQRISLQNV